MAYRYARVKNATATVTAVLVAGSVHAQDFRQGAPQQLPPQRPIVTPLPDSAVVPAPTAAPAVTLLNGVVFVAQRADLVAGGASAPVGGIDVTRTPLLGTPAFEAAVRPFLGKPASVADLNRIARAALAAQRIGGRPVVDVSIPEQDVTGGVVQFVVSEFKVGKVIVEGNKHFPTATFTDAIRLAPGQPVDQAQLIADLNFLSLNPFRRIDVLYQRGEVPMTTDVIFRVADRVPLRAYAGFDNSGTPTTKRQRLSAGLNWGRAFGGDGQLNYQATVSPDFFESRVGTLLAFQSHSLTLIQPLANRDVFVAFGTYQKVASAFGTFGNQTGRNLQSSLRYTHGVSADPARRLALSFGYDFKQTDNDLLFGATGITQDTQVHQLVADLTATKQWRAGVFGLAGTLYLSPGGIGDRNSDSAFQPFNPPLGSPLSPRTGTFGAKARYAYLRATVSQATPLGSAGVEARTRVTGQLASDNLLPTEQLAAAGNGFVRGYDPSAVLGARGVIAAQEFWLPPVAMLGDDAATRDALLLGAFIEAGQVGNLDRQPTERKWSRTAASGIAATWNIGPYLQARADYGWQLRRIGTAPRSSLGNVSVTIGF
jgi:hemolysin activation/secretion protein